MAGQLQAKAEASARLACGRPATSPILMNPSRDALGHKRNFSAPAGRGSGPAVINLAGASVRRTRALHGPATGSAAVHRSRHAGWPARLIRACVVNPRAPARTPLRVQLIYTAPVGRGVRQTRRADMTQDTRDQWSPDRGWGGGRGRR